MNKNNIFISKAKKVHGNKYDYSKVKYVNNKTKIDIICKFHDVFRQSPSNHIIGQGCPKCGRINAKNKNKGNKNLFIEKANQKHCNKYDYSW